MLRSIRVRLILSSAIPSLLFLAIGAFVVLQLARSVQRAEFTDTLVVELVQLIAWAQVDDEGIFDPKLPGATRFETAFSGWYYQVFNEEADGTLSVAATSQSLLQARLNLRHVEEDTDRWFTSAVGPRGEPLMIVVQRIDALTLADGRDIPNPDASYLVAVARNEEVLRKSDADLYRALAIGAAVVLAFVLLATAFLVVFGLRPLEEVGRSLHAIRSGEAERLKGDFPSEIEPLANEINLLIDENEKVVERARTQVGNLAHALKTPLSILMNEARGQETSLSKSVREQVGTMKGQVDRYLARARVAATSQVLGARTEVAPALERMGRALEKINLDRGITLDLDLAPALYLRGEKQDLEEVVGNLLENAFRFAKTKIRLSATREDGDVIVMVEDDGPGIPEDVRPKALKRGQRLDETTPGTGLGLNIVTDIVSAYGGAVDLDDSEFGGLLVRITLPAVR